MNTILGISAFYHDSAACLLHNGTIVAAAQEERFTRKKHDADFPCQAIRYCLEEANLSLSDIDAIVFYEKPLLKFERLLSTYVAYAPRGWHSFHEAMSVWLDKKLRLDDIMRSELIALSELCHIDELPPLFFTEHHQSHAASAFYPSPFSRAAVLCLDGVGEWTTTSAWLGDGNTLSLLWELPFPHSLGLLYSAFTYYTGFKVNSGEYKVMGLAPYGEPRYVQKIYDYLIDVKPDGTFKLNMEYFQYCTGFTMTNEKFAALFGGLPREPESALTQRELDLACSVQEVTETIMVRLVRTLHNETGVEHLCLSGGVALNCVGNGKILRDRAFQQLWIQPAAGDAGGALGAALALWYKHHQRTATATNDAMQGCYLGPSYSNQLIEQFLQDGGAVYERLDDKMLYEYVTDELITGKVVGWFQGRMEFGPRALGARSILGDPRSPRMQSIMNLKIKHRESFRPFAPSILRESLSEYFELDIDSPYMLLVANVQERRRLQPTPEQEQSLWGIDWLNISRSDIPAVTHVDYSARIQTVHEETNPRYYRLLKTFAAKTNCPVLINTSFNVRGEPIVCTPEDAYRCFMHTEMDVLVLGNCVLQKSKQQPLAGAASRQVVFALD